MITHNINPVLLNLGPLQIRYYGLIYALGFVLAYFLLPKIAKARGIKFSKDDAADLIVYMIIGVVLGSRIVYAVVYNFPYFIQNPLSVFALWQGGLSFHGGLIGATIGAYLFSKKKKVNFYDVVDMSVIPAALGLAMGRIANFINAELWGRASNLPFCIDYSKNQYVQGLPEDCRHPSQIYASIKNLIIFSSLWILKDKNIPRGFLFWSFVTLYGLFRTIVEFFRMPDEQIGFLFGYLSMGQLLSIPMFILGVGMLVWLKKKG